MLSIIIGYLTNLLNLKINRLLIGILMILLTFSIYFNYVQYNEAIIKDAKCQSMKDSLRNNISTIIISYEKRHFVQLESHIIEMDSIINEYNNKLNKLSNQQLFIRRNVGK